MLSNLPDNVTQADIDRLGSICTDELTVDEFIRSISEYGDTSYSTAPDAIVEMYGKWLRDDHSPLHEDDDAEELWDKFLASLVKQEVN
jgi:hypothetical protein